MKHRVWSQDSMDEAIRLVRNGIISISAASRQFDIPRMTLSDRVHNEVDYNCD